MRINNINERLNHTLGSIQYYFDNEYKYYRVFNCFPFAVDQKEHISLYRRLNVQLLVTKRCPFHCPFCIERENPVGGKNEQEELQIVNLIKVLKSMKESGLEPTVSITGGEPMLKPAFVGTVIDILDGMNVLYNINTSGYIGNEDVIAVLKKAKRINLSVHSADAKNNAMIFDRVPERYWLDPIFENATIQKVFNSESECELSAVTGFVHNFPQKRFSLRFPTYDVDVDTLEWKRLFRSLEDNCQNNFIQQKVGDYYWYEDWSCAEKHLHLSFSSLKQLRRNQEQDRDFVRAVIIEPNGDIKYDWI